MKRRCLRLTLIGLVALGHGTCAHPQTIQPPTAPTMYVLPFAIPSDDVFCAQQFDGTGSCIRVGDLRKLLGSMGKA